MDLRKRHTVQNMSERRGFRDLPAELRVQIHECAFAPAGYLCCCQSLSHSNTNAVIDESSNRSLDFVKIHRDNDHRNLPVALLRTCRQIHEEARDVVFESNSILLSSKKHLETVFANGKNGDLATSAVSD